MRRGVLRFAGDSQEIGEFKPDAYIIGIQTQRLLVRSDNRGRVGSRLTLQITGAQKIRLNRARIIRNRRRDRGVDFPSRRVTEQQRLRLTQRVVGVVRNQLCSMGIERDRLVHLVSAK